MVMVVELKIRELWDYHLIHGLRLKARKSPRHVSNKQSELKLSELSIN